MWFQTLLIYSATLITIILTILYVYFKYKYTTWEKLNIPHLKPIFPYGNIKSLITLQETIGDSFRGIYTELTKQTKSFGGFYNFSRPTIMILDPELCKTIMTKDFDSFQDRGLYYDEKNDPLSAHLVALKGQRWKNSRAIFTPNLTSAKIKFMFNTVLQVSKELGNIFDAHKGEAIDIQDIFARQATDVIGTIAFGIDCNSLQDPDTEFRKQNKKIFQFSFKNAIIDGLASNFPIVLQILKIPQISTEVSNFFMSILRQTVEYREKNNITRKDFLDVLIRLKNKQSVLDDLLDKNKEVKEGITFNELAAHAFVFFAAGFETTSSTLSFCLYELVSNPEIQEKVRMEIKSVVKEYDGQLTFEGIMEMKYMDKVFQEVLRKYPPVSIIQRQSTKDYKIPNRNITIPKGTDVFISILGIQNNPEFYPNPEKFDPERFSDEEKAKRRPYTYLPFGEGPRKCIGMRFALLEVKIVLSVLLMDFKFKLDPKTITPIAFDPKCVFLSPKNTIWIQTERI